MNSADDLARSYQWCYRVARNSGSSFYRAFWLLERPQRNAMFALYAFARITDDLSDAPSPSHSSDDLTARIERLNAWKTQLDQRTSAGAAHTNPTTPSELAQYEPLWPALRHTVKTYRMPLELLEDLVAGVAMDLQPVRLMEWSDVDRYCYHVASTIGLACTSIWQADESLPLQQAIDCGLAFQMTNILRDLREDAARNRIYVPLAELERYGCDVESWLAGAPRGNWPELVSSVIERTRALYASGARTIDHLPQPGARMFALMWSSYRQLLETVDRQKAFLWTNRRVRVTSGQQLKLFAKALVTPTTSERLSRER